MDGREHVRVDDGRSPSRRTLGKLTLIEQIGEGGMARIFLARSRGLGGFEKLVVVKQILPRLAEDAELVERFFQEARLTATLDHPNIATVYEVDKDGDDYFYSMEYVRGRDLLKVCRRAKQRGRVLRLDEIIAIVAGLCAGLHHAHTRIGSDGRPLGIVHRDVSPSNVLVSFDGAVKLADFGVAKARLGMVSTVAGTLRGKIAYMSPEQCRGEAIDRRSDVYSVGALLWELIEGKRLQQADDEIGMVRRIAEGELPKEALQHPEATPALERIVRRALTREPAARYPSAHALQVELEEHARRLELVLSPRTIAALMHELFEDEIQRELGELAGPATAPFVRVELDPPANARDDVTPATATLAPPKPEVSTSTTSTPPTPRARRSWSGVAIGLALGTVIGSGALWLARADTREAPRSEPERSEPAPIVPPIEASTPAVGAAERPAPVHELAATPAAPAAIAPVVPAEDRGGPKHRARRRKPLPQRERPLDLDAPLPPGQDG